MSRPPPMLDSRHSAAGSMQHGDGTFEPKIEFVLLLGAWTLGFAALVLSLF